MHPFTAKSFFARPMSACRVLLTAALFALGLESSALADTRYTYTGHAYTSCAGAYCTGGPYALSATFTTTLTGSALDNLPFTDITSTITSFVFTDGSGLRVDQNTVGAHTSISISTDASGHIVSWLAGGYANSEQVQMQTNWQSPFGFIPGRDFSETTADFAGDYGFVDNNPGIWTSTPPLETTFGPPSSANPSGTYAEPVNTATGSYFFQRTDLALPGRSLPLVFTRTYNSRDLYSGPLGHGWTHSYNIFLLEDQSGNVVIKQGDGHEEFYTRTTEGAYRSQFGGVFNILGKNSDGTFTLTTHDQSQLQFSNNGKLTQIVDKNGNALRFSYNAAGNLTTITDTVGRTITLIYDTQTHIVQIIDPIGRTVQYSYDAESNLVSHADPSGARTRYEYDAAHQVNRITDQRNNTLVENTYDETFRVIAQTNGRGFTTTFEYGAPGLGQTRITDPRGNTTIHTHDAQLRLIKITDSLSKEVKLTYDENNNRTSITDKNGNITRFAYDDRGNTTSITDPLLNTIDLTYDAGNSLTSIIDARQSTTAFTYDAKGNLISIKDASGKITIFTYTEFGQILRATDARNSVTNYFYDEQGNLAKVTDALGGITARQYDAIGRLVSLNDPKGHTITASYDANSRLTQIRDALQHATSYRYDPVGNVVTITDAKGHQTKYNYDQVNNLTSVTDALGHSTRYAYDENNNRVGLTDANEHTRTYAFDALNRLISITDPLGNNTVYGYDAGGNVVSIIDANKTKNEFAYDADSRLRRITYGDGAIVSYSYDPNGNRLSMVDQRGTKTYTYDALNQLTQVNHPEGSIVGYSYDAVGNRTGLTYPDGRSAIYDYDALNRPTKVRSLRGQETQYSYDAASNLSGIIYPNNTAISYGYDAADRLVRVTNQRMGDVFAQFDYSLDELGNRTGVRQNGPIAPAMTVSYAYDELSQLMAEEESHSGRLVKRREYTYDPVGNRLTLTRLLINDDGSLPKEVINYTYDADNRLLQAGNTTFTYDANGSRLMEITPEDRTIEYAYDAANRLVRVVQNGRAVTYVYDGDGNKIEQAINARSSSETFRFLNDVAASLSNDIAALVPVVLKQDRVEGGSIKDTIHYLYGLDRISQELLAGSWREPQDFFYHTDGLGSTIALTDGSARTQTGYQYDAWGNLERKLGEVRNRFRFTGEEQDPETGLYYLRARWYDPAVGRFLTKDPLGAAAQLPQSISQYAYVFNNPANLVDPLGLWGWPKFVKKAASGLKVAGVVTAGAVLGAAAGEIAGGTLGAVVGCVVGLVAGPVGCLAGAGTGAFVGIIAGGSVGSIYGGIIGYGVATHQGSEMPRMPMGPAMPGVVIQTVTAVPLTLPPPATGAK